MLEFGNYLVKITYKEYSSCFGFNLNNQHCHICKFRVQLKLRFALFCFQIAKWEFAENVLSGTQTNVLGPAQHAREKGRIFPFNFQNFLKMLVFWHQILTKISVNFGSKNHFGSKKHFDSKNHFGCSIFGCYNSSRKTRQPIK